jgi:hypothetical protein
MRGRRAGLIGLAAGGLMVAIAGTLLTGALRPQAAPATSPSPVPVDGPVLYYELLDADGSRLIERRLDGRSQPRVVATRNDAEYGRTWIVDPGGTLAVAVIPGPADQRLLAVSVASGATLWEVRTPIAPLDVAVWARDGRRFAVMTGGDENEVRRALVVDAATGRTVSSDVPEDAVLQGFEPNGSLILRQRLERPAAEAAVWRFLRFDPVLGTVGPVVGLPDVGSSSDTVDDVAPNTGIGVDATADDAAAAVTVRLWSLAGGRPRALATFPSTDRIVLDPAGEGVAVGMTGAITLVGFDGSRREVFSSEDSISEFGWSDSGDYLVVGTDHPEANLTLIERATGRTVAIPQYDAVAQSLFVRVLGGIPLPASPLPASEPRPTPTASGGTVDVAGFAGLYRAWTETDESGAGSVHAERIVPTEDGGVRVVAAMPDIELEAASEPGEGPPTVALVPRPASGDVLIWVEDVNGARGWLWDGGASRTPLTLPRDWPIHAFDPAWSPDGRTLAASAGRATDEGEFEGIFALARPGARRTTVLPVVGDYDRLEGWWSDTELRVGHGICSEGCGGRYASSARLRITDGRLRQLTPADRAKAPIDLAIWDGQTIVLSLINDERSDDIRIDWPAELGGSDDSDVIGFVGDGPTLVVAHQAADGLIVRAIDDPVGRAVDGRLANPEPRELGTVPGRAVSVDISPDLGWVVVHDRVDNIQLVRLADARAWPLDRDRVVVWR